MACFIGCLIESLSLITDVLDVLGPLKGVGTIIAASTHSCLVCRKHGCDTFCYTQAVEYNCTGSIDDKLSRGVDVNYYGYDGLHILHEPAAIGPALCCCCPCPSERVEMVQHLVKRGADINAPALKPMKTDYKGVMLAGLARKAGHMIQTDLKNGDTPLVAACRFNRLKTGKALLNAKANTAIVNIDNRTVLTLACKHSQWDFAALLLDSRSGKQLNINAVDKRGKTALTYALASKKDKALTISNRLIASGAAVGDESMKK